MNTISRSTNHAEELQRRIQGRVISSSDAEYQAARMAWNLSVDQHPALIAFVESAEDIRQVVLYSREAGLSLGVQATGHGVIRPADDRLLINTSRMTGVQLNPQARSARISAGTKWGQVLAQAQLYGLAPLLGSSPDVGAVGYTLGGGLGWLGRKYGLAVDSVLSYELVNGKGELVRASRNENPDLFWALRGGGGNFGVVTALEVALYPVSTVYGGNLMYPPELAQEVIQRYRDWIADAPDELTSSVVIMNYPPIPEMPEFLRGKTFVMVRGCYCGEIQDGEALLAPWREWQAPVMDEFKSMPFAAAASISNDPVDPVPSKASGVWLRELSEAAIDTLVRYGTLQVERAPLVVTEVRHAGGAIKRVDPQETAYSQREAELALSLIGMTPTPEMGALLSSYMARLMQELAPVMTGGVYLNFVEGTESRARSRDGFTPEAYQRLAALKAQYDPENLFDFSFDLRGA